ncbi:glycosyltransferase [Pengzhenrongella sp.]|uniref:glycosyltransferase n=1 Tax=Pengzhenrongella sp. TaxID=2888820 RepID=UPI002F9423E1
MQIGLVSSALTVALARSTVRSAFDVDDQCVVHVLDLDGSYLAVRDERVVTRADVGVDPHELHVRAILLDPDGLVRWTQPALLRHALLAGPTVLAVRAGVLLLSDPAELADVAAREEVALIARSAEPLPADRTWPGPADVLAAGSYNPDLLAVSRAATAFLDLWEKLAADPRTATDRWLEAAASYLPHHTLTAPRLLVSAWTGPSARIGEGVGDVLEVDGLPAVAVDLTGLDPVAPWLLDTRADGPPRVRLSAHPGLARLVASYAAGVQDDVAAAPERPADATTAVTSLGVAVHPQLRTVFCTALEANPARSLDALPDPFDPERTAELTAWLTKPVADGSDLGLGRYLASIYRSRPDLRDAFPGVPGEHVDAFIAWAGEHGRHEDAYSPYLIDLALDAVRDDDPQGTAFVGRGTGVNVVGYLRAELGVGESARLMLDALAAGGIPHATASVDRHLQSRQGASFTEAAPGAPFDTTLMCVNADMTPTVAAAVPSLLARSYRIGMWYWEVEDFPTSQHEGFRHVDEVWVATDFVRRAIEPYSPVPVRTITPPLPRPTSVAATQGRTRADLGLPERPTFLFSFDYLSTVERKNPWGLVDAFEAAFTPGEGPLLVIKSINADRRPDQAERLRLRVAGSKDVVLLEDYLDAADRDALVDLCDCYISLHRSEGLGLTMAEAMALGKPVIATGYSGNLQFMTDENSFLVPWTPTTIPVGCEPYPAGGTWAEPDLDAAAGLMRLVLEDTELAAARGRQAAQDIRILHSPEAAGAKIAARLDELVLARRTRRRTGTRDQVLAVARRALGRG